MGKDKAAKDVGSAQVRGTGSEGRQQRHNSRKMENPFEVLTARLHLTAAFRR
jgi:hypothetical protein